MTTAVIGVRQNWGGVFIDVASISVCELASS